MERTRRDVPSDVALLYYLACVVGAWMKVFNLVTRNGLADHKLYTQLHILAASQSVIIFLRK
jgi:hypothetical protein